MAEVDPGPTEPASPTGQPEAEPEPDPRAVFAAAAAVQVAATINAWNAELAAAGRASIPPVLVDSVFRPACERVIVRFAPASIGGPTTDLIIVAGVGGYTWHARSALLKATTPEPEAPNPPPPPTSSRPPAPAPAPGSSSAPAPAPVPATSGPVWAGALFGG